MRKQGMLWSYFSFLCFSLSVSLHRNGSLCSEKLMICLTTRSAPPLVPDQLSQKNCIQYTLPPHKPKKSEW